MAGARLTKVILQTIYFITSGMARWEAGLACQDQEHLLTNMLELCYVGKYRRFGHLLTNILELCHVGTFQRLVRLHIKRSSEMRLVGQCL